MDRKQELRRLLAQMPPDSTLRYVDHIDRHGKALFQRVCKLDLEGIVAKLKHGPYVTDRENTTWFKIRNREYSQMVGREWQGGIPASSHAQNWKKRVDHGLLRSCWSAQFSRCRRLPMHADGEPTVLRLRIEICGPHTERCSVCREISCPSCLSFHQSEHSRLLERFAPSTKKTA